MSEPLTITAATVDITPSRPAPLFGYEGRPGAFTRIVTPLEMNAVLLRQGDTSLLLASADLLYATGAWEDEARVRIAARRPGTRAAAVFGATHNHFAPAVDPTKPALGKLDTRYAGFVERQVGVLLDTLLSAAEAPAAVTYQRGEAAHAVNRRRRGWHVGRRGIRRTMAPIPNPKGPKDESVHAVVLRDPNGEPLAVIWSYACHPTGFPERNAVSAEFPGVVRRALRDVLGRPSLPVLFLQGFAGNIRPPALDRSRRPVAMVRRALNGMAFGAFSSEEYATWSGSLADRVSRLTQGEALPPALSHATVEFPLAEILPGAPAAHAVRLRSWTLGERLRFVGFSAEMMSEFGDRLGAHFPGDRIVPVSCLGSVFGYLPMKAMLREGGYEAGGYFLPFGLRGRFTPDLEDRLEQALRDLAAGPAPGARHASRSKEMTGTLRILWITNMYPYPEKRVFRGIFVGMQAEALRALGGMEVDIALVAQDRGAADYLLANPRVRRTWKAGGYHLVHVHYGISGLAALFLPPRVPLVATLYGSDLNLPTHRAITRVVAQRCRRRIFVSRRLTERWPSSRNVVIPNGVDFDQCRPEPRDAACRALGLDPAKRYVLFGSFPEKPAKGYELFCEVVDRVRRSVPEAEPLILSEPRQTYDRVVQKLNASSVLLFTSHEGHEGSPTVVKEAVAAGLPVVTVDVGDVRETLDGVSPGCVVDWPNGPRGREAWVGELTRAVEAVIRDGRRSDGRERREHLRLERIAERTRTLYLEVLGSPD